MCHGLHNFLTASGHKIAISPKRSKSTFTIFQDGLIAESCLNQKDVSYEAYRRKRGYRSRQFRSQIRIVRPIQEQLDRVDDGLFAKLDEGLVSLAEHPMFSRSKPKCFKWFLGNLRLAAAAHYSVVYTIDEAANLRILRVRFSKWKAHRKARTLSPKLRKSLRQASTRNEDGRRILVRRLKRTDRFVGYSGETAEELFSYAAEDQCDSLVQGFREGIQKKAARKGPLTPEERVVLAVTALEQEVNNGGFDPFFRNSSRKFAPQIVPSLLSI